MTCYLFKTGLSKGYLIGIKSDTWRLLLKILNQCIWTIYYYHSYNFRCFPIKYNCTNYHELSFSCPFFSPNIIVLKNNTFG
nr:MAG TPA: hypothetical protein [Caudoviricetes sp.]